MTRVIVLRSLATSTDTESMTHAEEARVVHPDLTGKKVLVTGGARGLGVAMAAALAKAGASVMSADLLDDEGRQTADEIAGETHH